MLKTLVGNRSSLVFKGVMGYDPMSASKNLLPLVSINIPTYNSEKTLNDCLRSIVSQSYNCIEILVIDSYSFDRTLEIAKEFGVKVYFADTLSEARKLGVEKSLGKYVFFVDSDQVLTPSTIKKCVEKCESEGFDAVTLFECSLVEKNTFTERVIAYDKWLFHSQHDDHPIYGSAIPRFFRTSIFRTIKWPVGLGVQEHNIIYFEAVKAGAKVTFMEVPIYHREVHSLAHFARKFYRYGSQYIVALHENKEMAIAHSMPRRVYFSRKALKNPQLFAGLFLLYFVKGFAALMGVLSYYL